MRKRLRIISMIFVLLVGGITGCGQQSKEPVKIESFTLSEYYAIKCKRDVHLFKYWTDQVQGIIK